MKRLSELEMITVTGGWPMFCIDVYAMMAVSDGPIGCGAWEQICHLDCDWDGSLEYS